MARNSSLRWLALLLLAVCATTAALAQENYRTGELSNTDRLFMQQQRSLLADLTSRNFGRQFNGAKDNDLELLQLLLDKRLVRPDQTRELQAMGIIMGDLLATDLGMHWVIYEDRLGRSRALRLASSDNYLFPVTMIARRQEADNHTTVAAIYQKAHDIITPLKPPLPYQ